MLPCRLPCRVTWSSTLSMRHLTVYISQQPQKRHHRGSELNGKLTKTDSQSFAVYAGGFHGRLLALRRYILAIARYHMLKLNDYCCYGWTVELVSRSNSVITGHFSDRFAGQLLGWYRCSDTNEKTVERSLYVHRVSVSQFLLGTFLFNILCNVRAVML